MARLASTMVWIDDQEYGAAPLMLDVLLPMAEQGLRSVGVDDGDVATYLGVIERRLDSGRSGAVWQREMLARLGRSMPREQALHSMLEQFIDKAASIVIRQFSPSRARAAPWRLAAGLSRARRCPKA